MFIIRDWQVAQKIDDPNESNIRKLSFNFFPGFSQESFPFLVVSGDSSFNLINTKTGHMDVLIYAKTSSFKG